MCSNLGNIMVKATSRTVHHEFGKYLDMAHSGRHVVITKRGKPWATLAPIVPAKKRKLDWNQVFERARAVTGGRMTNAVDAMLGERELERS